MHKNAPILHDMRALVYFIDLWKVAQNKALFVQVENISQKYVNFSQKMLVSNIKMLKINILFNT